MKKIASTIFVALLIAGASSVKAQNVKKGNATTKATTKTVKTDVKKVDVVKAADATLINPDGTVKEVKTIQVNDKSTPKTKKLKKTEGVVVGKNVAIDEAIKQD